jgi:hypothetical protein
LGTWNIVNESADYKTLPEMFSLNMERVAQQIVFNDKRESLDVPDNIYYLAYSEERKNSALENLFDQKNIGRINGKLEIDMSTIRLSLSPSLKRWLKKS